MMILENWSVKKVSKVIVSIVCWDQSEVGLFQITS
jgi:hypothetical protein